MEFETEVKIRVEDLEGMEKILKENGAKLFSDCFEINVLFDKKGELFGKGEALRLRKFCGRAKLTFKGRRVKNLTYKVREEIETEVVDFDSTAEILKKLGFEESFYYEKKRKNYRIGKVIVSIDKTPIGDFIEIEGEEEKIDAIAHLLGFNKGSYITKSYVELGMERGLGRLCFQCGD